MTPAKRAFDVAAAALGLIVMAPLFGAVALLVRGHDWGPVYFRQVRVGRRGVPFRIWKFRTMVPGTEHAGPQVTAGDDARITPIGAWLRRFKLDELPQLINVLAGQMSIVGPRPEVPRFVAMYSAEQRALLDYVPGLTDPASLAYRGEGELLAGVPDPDRVYAERILPEKARLSLDYARRATMLTDLRLVAATLRAVGRGGRPAPVHDLSPGAP